MANLTNKLFGLHNASTVDGTDSRTQGDENLNALAGSMETSFPNLDDIACDKSGAQLNDTTEASASETIIGTWRFESQFNLTDPTLVTQWSVNNDNGNDSFEIRAEPSGAVTYEITKSPVTHIFHQDTSVDADLDVTGALTVTNSIATTSGGIDALSGNVNALNVAASAQVSAPTVRGTSAVTSDAGVTATTFVSGDTWRVGNATAEAGVGSVPDAVHNAIEVFDESGSSLGYIYAFATAS